MAEFINMPKLGFDMAEGTIIRWLKKEGEEIKKGDVIAEIETDKATVEVESSADGFVRRLVVEEGSIVPVGSPIAIVGTKDESIEDLDHSKSGKEIPKEKSLPITTEKNVDTSMSATVRSDSAPASPLARKIAKESRVDLSTIVGTGPGGRIVKRDVENALVGKKIPVGGIQNAALGGGQILSGETVKFSKLRQTIARRMTESKNTIPHFYVTHEYRVDKLMDIRKQFNTIQDENEKISVNDFIIKGIALTLRQFPNLNSSLKENSTVQHSSINIGVAVSVEGGLMTVVCREADTKSISQISSEIREMAARAREGKVKPDDIEGSTFSVSNLGMFDVENFSAIINPPEVAIVAVGTAHEQPVLDNGVVLSGWLMKATISVDHRASDGVEAARFMQALGKYIEEPLRLIL